MKYLFFFAFLSVTSLNLLSQTDETLIDASSSEHLESTQFVKTEPAITKTYNGNEDLYQRKVISYTKMKKAGITMGVVGGASVIVGAIMTSSANWESYSTQTSSGVRTNDPTGVAGVGLLAIGIPVTVTGIILGAIGAKKVKFYQGKLDNLSLNISTTHEHCGVILTYRF